MDATTSISKGCFAFVPSKTKQNKNNDHSVIFSQPWYKAYKNIWSSVKNKIQKLNKEISESIVNDVVDYVAERNFEYSHIQTAILFTGINLPDHDNLYEMLSSKLKNKLGCYISVLSPNYTTVKAVIENLVFDFINSDNNDIMDSILTDSDEEESSVNGTNKIKKSECNMQNLLDWYNQLKPSKPYKCSIKLQDGNEKVVNKPPLVIIMGDLEMYDVQVLRRFLLILRIYISEIPIILIFGVATTLSMIHRSLSHQILSKLVIRIFQSQSSLVFLNSILEKIFFTSQCPFQLSGAVFKYLTDTFLLYDFSVSTFIKGMQFAVMDHFYYSDVCVLCTDASNTAKTVKQLKRNQIQEILKLPSVLAHNDYLSRNNLPTLNKSDNIKNEITVLLNNFHSHTSRFHLAVRCLHNLVADLPQAPLGKHIREIYVEAMQTSIVDSPEFKNCFNLLAFFSKDEFLEKLNALIVLFTPTISDNVIVGVLNKLNNFKAKIISSDLNKIVSQPEQTTGNIDLDVKNRAQLRQKLLENVNRGHRLNEYEQLRKETLHYLSQEVFKLFLKSPKTLPLHEIFIYDNASMVCAHLDGKPRSIIQTALKNPHHYLECHCCKSDNKNEMLKTMPDTCIAYKLHLECGTLINLYDWLQSFAAVVDCKSSENDDTNEGGENYISPEIQARFWQSVSELQLEGFIQRTKRKVDHVERLTFDGN